MLGSRRVKDGSVTSGFSERDAFFMARALRLAARGRYSTDPNPRVGCVVVHNDKIVGEGWHQRAGGAHAEIVALENAGVQARGATAYVTLEPCCYHGKTPPCTKALIETGVSKLIAAMHDPNPKVAKKGMETLAEAGIETEYGLLESDAEHLNRGFCKRMRTGQPFVFSKLAMSLDGRTGMASGESQWITGEHARKDVHRLRAQSGAIVTGVETVMADDPSLNARLEMENDVEIAQPLRVIVDSTLRTPTTSRMGRLPGRSLIATVVGNSNKKKLLEQAGFEVISLPSSNTGRVDLTALLKYLAVNEVNEVMVEAGTTLNGAMLQSRLVDELVVYLAPCVLGDGGRGLFHLPEIERISDKVELRLSEIRQVGEDLRLQFMVKC